LDGLSSADALKMMMELRGVTQGALSRQLNTDPDFIKALLLGREPFTEDLAQRLGTALDIAPEFFSSDLV
jgi:plasmid maintenance system antidote protein VapI